MRLFIGTFLSLSNQGLFDRFIEDLVCAHPQALRAVPKSSAHLTYAFCPEADEDGAAAILGAVTDTADAHQPFDILLGSPHVVSAGSRPRLVCADILRGDTEVHQLTADLFNRLQAACPGLSLSPSKAPHVTLARFRKDARRSDSQTASAWLMRHGSKATARDRIAHLQMVSSTLTAKGPTYAILQASQLVSVSRSRPRGLTQ